MKEPQLIRRNSYIYCSTHPSYAAKRNPTSKCLVCKDLYAMKEDIYETLGRVGSVASKVLGMRLQVRLLQSQRHHVSYQSPDPEALNIVQNVQ